MKIYKISIFLSCLLALLFFPNIVFSEQEDEIYNVENIIEIAQTTKKPPPKKQTIEKTKCSKCGAMNPANNKYCSKCGKSLTVKTTERKKAKKEIAARRKEKYGIGFQSSFPAWGLSGTMDISDDSSIQGILGAFGDLKVYGVRGIRRFGKEEFWNTYGYGMIGGYSWTTETIMGFGAGVGIEYDWRVWSPDLPPVRWNLEVGVGFADFKDVDYNISTFGIGVGFHYRF